jgi:hypothetical protein
MTPPGDSARVINLPALPGFKDGYFSVQCLEGDRLAVTQGLRTVVLDIHPDSPVVLQVLDEGSIRLPPWKRSYAVNGSYCDMIGSRTISCHDDRGDLIWSKRRSMVDIVRAADRPLVAVLDSDSTLVFDSATGRLVNAASARQIGLRSVYEATFSNGHLIVSGICGDGTQLRTMVLYFSESGAIISSAIDDDVNTCGLGSSRPVLGVVRKSLGLSFVAAFRKGQ